MRRLSFVGALFLTLVGSSASAEQFFEIGDLEAHYMILDTLSLEPEVAKSYGIERARNLSIVTLSVLDKEGAAVEAEVSGMATNLLGIQQDLVFKSISEGDARYAIAILRHSEEIMRFEIGIREPDGRTHEIKFQQKLYLGME